MSNWEQFTAKTVSDALTEASVFFKVPSAMIEYDVVEEEKSGILGLFSRPAKIKARVKEEKPIEPEKTVKQNYVYEKADEEKKEEVNSEIKGERKSEEKKTFDINVDVESISKKFLTEVFEAMNISAQITAFFDKSEGVVNVNIEGEDMGVLIGKRGQTLDSLQYLTSLVVNRETSSYLKVKLDTENYRERRKATLENLAKNIAYKVKRTKRPVSLEPMNPYERRIIHSALQGDKFVDTHSEGEEPFRRVVVTLKKGYREYSGRSNSSSRYNNNRRDYYKKSFGNEKEETEVKTEE